jgi:hypothetical protein
MKLTLPLGALLFGMTAMSVSAAEFKFTVTSIANLSSKGIVRVSKVDSPSENVLVSLTDEVEAEFQKFLKGSIICVSGSVIPETTSILVREVKNCL